MNSISVLIADDHPLMRKGLREMIVEEDGLEVSHEASDGEKAIMLIREHTPDVAVIDVDMPRASGLEVARVVFTEKIRTGLVFLTMHREETLFEQAMDLGVQGYVLKENAATEVVEAIRAVGSGRHYLSPTISGFLVRRSDRLRLLEKETPGLTALTPAERKVLRLIGENKTSKEIAGELSVSYKTVENHRTNIAQKLDLRGSHAVLKFAIEHKSLL